MTRKEIYQKIKDEGLAEKIKRQFGKNYTNVKTEDLEKWIKANDFAMNKMDNIIEKCRKQPEKIKVNNTSYDAIDALYDGFKQLISTLVAHRAITPIEGEEIMDIVFK